jgi:hypothetical protein
MWYEAHPGEGREPLELSRIIAKIVKRGVHLSWHYWHFFVEHIGCILALLRGVFIYFSQTALHLIDPTPHLPNVAHGSCSASDS